MENKTLHQLKEGDRFYFVRDKRRIVWTVDEVENKERVLPWGGVESYSKYHLKDDKGTKKEEKVNYPVIYIRHI